MVETQKSCLGLEGLNHDILCGAGVKMQQEWCIFAFAFEICWNLNLLCFLPETFLDGSCNRTFFDVKQFYVFEILLLQILCKSSRCRILQAIVNFSVSKQYKLQAKNCFECLWKSECGVYFSNPVLGHCAASALCNGGRHKHPRGGAAGGLGGAAASAPLYKPAHCFHHPQLLLPPQGGGVFPHPPPHHHHHHHHHHHPTCYKSVSQFNTK